MLSSPMFCPSGSHPCLQKNGTYLGLTGDSSTYVYDENLYGVQNELTAPTLNLPTLNLPALNLPALNLYETRLS